jgi:hypothetical protein
LCRDRNHVFVHSHVAHSRACKWLAWVIPRTTLNKNEAGQVDMHMTLFVCKYLCTCTLVCLIGIHVCKYLQTIACGYACRPEPAPCTRKFVQFANICAGAHCIYSQMSSNAMANWTNKRTWPWILSSSCRARFKTREHRAYALTHAYKICPHLGLFLLMHEGLLCIWHMCCEA